MRAKTILTALGLIAFFIANTPLARADKATARVLFEDAMSLMKAQKYSEACPKFEESNRQDPSVGAQYQLGLCYMEQGRTASAWAMFDSAADMADRAGDSARAKTAHDRAKDLKSKLSYVQIDVPTPVAGLSVQRNDQTVGNALWGLPLPVDPGAIHVVANAPGFASWQTTITLAPNSDRQTIKIPELTCEDGKHRVAAGCEVCTAADNDCMGAPLPAPSATPPPATPATPVTPPPAASIVISLNTEPPPAPSSNPSSPPPSTSSHGIPAAAWVVGAVGLVSLGVAGVFDMIGASKWSSVGSHCDSTLQACDATGHDLQHQATTMGTLATVSLIAGGVLVVTGVTIAIIGSSSSESAPKTSLVVGPASLGVVGTF